MSRRRRTIAQRLVEAQHTAAMLTTFNEIDMGAVMELRARRQDEFVKRYGVKLGFTSFFVKAAIGALKAFPRINAEIQGDEIVLKYYYDVGIAVGAEEGLVVPVIRDADRLSFAAIESSVRDFAVKSRDGTLSLEDLRGGTFTITNGGVFGSMLSTPILNPPQVAILGLHNIQERPVVRDGQIVIRSMMYVALSYDPVSYTHLDVYKRQALNEALLRYPPGFTLNKKLARTLERRRDILADPDAATIDWATAETLAFASILADGVAVRLTGEDVERGTFSQRHALLRDDTTGAVHIPLQQIPQARAAFEVRNSPLSEAGVIGFEYGYSIQAPERLVVWEAQYGDFINTAQAIIDAYVTSGNAKWELKSSLVLLLPHGYEGQGPDHSTGRLERFLQAAAETNIRVANATTAAQYFHLLRRQAELLTSDPLPLIVMTPKSLLRNPLIYSALRELAEGRWQPVIDDAQAAADPAAVRRIILCSGKVYVDMIADSRRAARPDIALARVEQLYPFPAAEVTAILQAYPGATEVVWLQEEPANAGAWDFIHPRLQRLLDDAVPLRLIARPRRAAPAEGSMGMHSLHQKTLLDRAYELADEVSE